MVDKQIQRKSTTVVVIPVYNESRAIAKVISEIIKTEGLDLIVVDDGSTDGTDKILARFGDKITVFTMPTNCGKGAAMRAGADIAYNMKYQNIVFMDGDGQHNPHDIAKIVLGMNDSDMVLNHRILNFKTSMVSKFGRFMVRNVFNLLFGTKISDHLSGFRALRRDTYPKVRWAANDYGVEIEMLARSIMNGLSYCEISTPCGQRRYKGMGWGSGFLIMINIFRYRVFRSKLIAHPSKKKHYY